MPVLRAAGARVAQREHARQVQRPRLVGIGGERAIARGARAVDVALAEREVAAHRERARARRATCFSAAASARSASPYLLA